jgi:hypothetical protein
LQERAPPNITVLGAYTDNGTWAGAVAHFHSWDNDRYRYLGGVAKVDANLDYFGVANQARAYELDGIGLFQQLLVRIGTADGSLGHAISFRCQRDVQVRTEPV